MIYLPYFPKLKYLEKKWWHRLSIVVFIGWLIFFYSWPFRWAWDQRAQCMDLAFRTENFTNREANIDNCLKISGFKEITSEPLFVLILAIIIYIVPIVTYRMLLYIGTGDKWKT